jgi:uncharacterized protein YdhG (YjbR/CyaY superfamily)
VVVHHVDVHPIGAADPRDLGAERGEVGVEDARSDLDVTHGSESRVSGVSGFDEDLAHVRGIVLALEPDAEEGVSYGMPEWRLAGKPLLGLSEAKAPVGVYPFSPAVVADVADRLAGFTLTKGGVQCTPDAPVPDDVLREMVRLRAAEIRG